MIEYFIASFSLGAVGGILCRICWGLLGLIGFGITSWSIGKNGLRGYVEMYMDVSTIPTILGFLCGMPFGYLTADWVSKWLNKQL